MGACMLGGNVVFGGNVYRRWVSVAGGCTENG